RRRTRRPSCWSCRGRKPRRSRSWRQARWKISASGARHFQDVMIGRGMASGSRVPSLGARRGALAANRLAPHPGPLPSLDKLGMRGRGGRLEVELVDVLLSEDEGRPKQDFAAVDDIELAELARFD